MAKKHGGKKGKKGKSRGKRRGKKHTHYGPVKAHSRRVNPSRRRGRHHGRRKNPSSMAKAAAKEAVAVAAFASLATYILMRTTIAPQKQALALGAALAVAGIAADKMRHPGVGAALIGAGVAVPVVGYTQEYVAAKMLAAPAAQSMGVLHRPGAPGLMPRRGMHALHQPGAPSISPQMRALHDHEDDKLLRSRLGI